MTLEIKTPTFPESIADGTIAAWHKQSGEVAKRDEILVDIETDKVVLEVVAPVDGVLLEILKPEGDLVLSEEVIARFEEGTPAAEAPVVTAPGAADVAVAPVSGVADVGVAEQPVEQSSEQTEPRMSPAARKLADESGIDAAAITGSGRDGRITKADVAAAIANGAQPALAPVVPPAPPAAVREPEPETGERVERRVPMTRLRASIANRLVEAQQTAAMLTTFNEVDMAPIMRMRKQYQDEFVKRHNGTRLGFMSFFVRASVEALKRFPSVNASIDDNDIVYHGFYDIGVAVSTERGLVVPVIRDADALGMAQIENHVTDYGLKARDGKLSIEDMQGGTFTISNGGVFGSLLSTPILNPPQTAILGMHKIEDGRWWWMAKWSPGP